MKAGIDDGALMGSAVHSISDTNGCAWCSWAWRGAAWAHGTGRLGHSSVERRGLLGTARAKAVWATIRAEGRLGAMWHSLGAGSGQSKQRQRERKERKKKEEKRNGPSGKIGSA